MKLINKDAVVAQANIEITDCRIAAQEGILTEFGKGKLEGLEGIVDFINTLEVKEVDLEKEINAYMDYEMKFLCDEIGYDTFSTIAKHFFELGLKTQKGE